MKKWYGLSLFIGVSLMLVAVAATVTRSEPLEATPTANPTESPESSLTRLREAYRASQTALRSAEASSACLKWDIDQLADEITREGYKKVTRMFQKRIMQSDFFYRSFCQNNGRLHIKELIFQRRTSHIKNQNFHI